MPSKGYFDAQSIVSQFHLHLVFYHKITHFAKCSSWVPESVDVSVTTG
jgi:hypothetical protein